jgi:hypothetical protein
MTASNIPGPGLPLLMAGCSIGVVIAWAVIAFGFGDIAEPFRALAVMLVSANLFLAALHVLLRRTGGSADGD